MGRLFDVLLPDENGNVVVNSEQMSLETRDTLVYSTEKKLVVTIGVEDLIVIDSGRRVAGMPARPGPTSPPSHRKPEKIKTRRISLGGGSWKLIV